MWGSPESRTGGVSFSCRKQTDGKQTCANNERLGSTAPNTVKKSSGFNVDVQKGHFTAQFTQSEPHADEVRLVAHQQSNNVALFQRALRPEGARELVTSPVHILVRESLLFKENEWLIRVLPRLVKKAVEERGDPSLHTSLQSPAVPQKFEVINQIHPEEGKCSDLIEKESQQPCYHAAKQHSDHL